MRFLLTAVLAAFPLFAWGGSLADVEVFDRTAGQALPLYQYQGQWYVAGEPGHRYELRIRSRASQRLLAVTSVDGVNVVSGETAAVDQRGYVIDRWDSVEIEGWRKSLDEVARFYFTALPDSYAARTGRPDNVGVIGIALFRELQPRPYCCKYLDRQRSDAESPAGASGSPPEAARERSEPHLGTGHGEHESSPAQYVDFRRASTTPDETVIIYYDSRRNLVAQGVLPAKPRMAQQRPEAFPNDFVPDP
ncbi:MAG TPA: hypothetical protein VKB34_22905 [Povalibacter sp.]|nr:hypothetical protein [Povalibacter sp.]